MNLYRSMKMRSKDKKKQDYCTYEAFYTHLVVTTKQKSRAELQNSNKKGNGEKTHRKPVN